MASLPNSRIIVGGYLPEDGSGFYVSRPEDNLLLEYLKDQGTWINIFGCRTMGKTSLAIKHFNALREQGVRCAYIDVAIFSFESASQQRWIENLAITLALNFKLKTKDLLSVLTDEPDSSSCGVLVCALFEKLETLVQAPIFLVLDEIDSIMHLSWGLEVIAALRDVRGRQKAMTLCVVGLQALGKLCPSMSAPQAPFAKPIAMRDFPRTDTTVNHLKRAFTEESCPTTEALFDLLDLSGGQPLLTMEFLYAMMVGKITDSTAVKRLAATWVENSRNDDRNHFEQLLNIAAALTQPLRPEEAPRHFAALTVYEELLLDRSSASEAHKAPHKDLLLLVGLVRQNGELIEPKGKVFEDRLDLKWVRDAQKTVAALMQQPQSISEALEVVRAGATDRILVINTGGTIGMVVNSQGMVVPPETNREFLDYFSHLKLIGDVEMINLFPPRDSINVFPQQWKAIAKCIFERRHEGFKGVVVAHGTDTLAYTASAVAFALGPNLTFPVVFTGAQTGPNVAFGDAHINLYRACETAKKNIPEVVICFGNYVYRAVRAQKKDDRRFEGFESPTYPPLAEITGEITVRSELLRSCPKKPLDISLKADFESSVLIVPMFPGLEPRFFEHLLNEQEGAPASKGVIIQTLGAGNVSSIDPYSFIPFVRDAYLRGIPVIVTSHYPPDPGTHTKYTPAAAPLKAGAIHAGNMTMPAAVTKFRWVLAQVLRDPGWEKLSPSAKRTKVELLMTKKALIGEF